LETVLAISSLFLWLVVLANVFLTLALIRRINANAPKSVGLPAGTPAPDFKAEMLNGGTATLATYTGLNYKVAFLFISTHCGPCRDILTALRGQRVATQQAGIELVLVSGDEREDTEALVAELELDYPLLIAPQSSNTFFSDYKISMTPSFCLLDQQRKVQASGLPSVQAGGWKALIDTWAAVEASPAGARSL
jgi:peroxiredoxin